MSMFDRWEVLPGQIEVYPPGQKPPKRDPHKLFTDEQYLGVIEQEEDPERRRMMSEVLDEGDYEALNEMIANDPDTEVQNAPEPGS